MLNEMPKTDAEWRAEEDARTMAEADIIGKDASRLAAAQTAAKRLIEEKEKEAAGLKKLVDKKKMAETIFNKNKV